MKKFQYGILAILAVLLLFACSRKTQETFGYQINYVNTEGVRLVEENYIPEAKGGTGLIQELLDRMRVPQYSGEYHSAIPDSVELQELSLEGKSAFLDFNSAYLEMDTIEEILMRTAVVETLCQIPDVEDVTFTVDGEPLLDAMGAQTGKMTADTFIDTRGDGINSYKYASLTLYFPSQDGEHVSMEMRNVHYSTNTSLERVIVEQMLKGPANIRLGRVASASTKILGVSLKDGLCTVNLDSTINQAPGEGNASPEACLYAMVNALCDNCRVERVQFQINGESDIKFRDSISLVEPFERKSSLILSVENNQTETLSEGTSESSSKVLEPSIGVDPVMKGGNAS
ncbi:MAG: GerMN domain-containing protein [Candidatus Limivivens sp.]|nr:GerMN domain-containing protein [Candidatus Limivivens sp.]